MRKTKKPQLIVENVPKPCAKDHTFNGWTNYETWNVALWLDNDQGTQEYWAEAAQDVYSRRAEADKFLTKRERARFMLAELLKGELEDQAQDMLEAAHQSASMFADLLNAALSEVNWPEIAEHYIEDVVQSEERARNGASRE